MQKYVCYVLELKTLGNGHKRFREYAKFGQLKENGIVFDSTIVNLH